MIRIPDSSDLKDSVLKKALLKIRKMWRSSLFSYFGSFEIILVACLAPLFIVRRWILDEGLAFRIRFLRFLVVFISFNFDFIYTVFSTFLGFLILQKCFFFFHFDLRLVWFLSFYFYLVCIIHIFIQKMWIKFLETLF